ncbi:MAG: hypothetical protein ACI9RL_001390 [Candidatus Paceibacteria bacterium]|jgi:hypothetical protein
MLSNTLIHSHKPLIFSLVLCFFLGQPVIALINASDFLAITILNIDTEGETEQENKKDQDKEVSEEEKIISREIPGTFAITSLQNSKRLGAPHPFFGDIILEISIPPPDVFL